MRGNDDFALEEPRVLVREPMRSEESPTVSVALPPAAAKAAVVAPGLRKKTKKRRQWESPLFLIGGGVLVLLVICGGTVALILSRRGSDEKLAEARKYRDAGAFAQAISSYQEFVDSYSSDASWSDARMELSLARLRQAVEAGGDFRPALEIAQTELQALENDKNFDQQKLAEARPELAEILPRIASGLADQADASTDPAAAEKIAQSADDALVLCRNAKYVSKELRDDAALADVEAKLARVSRRQADARRLATRPRGDQVGDRGGRHPRGIRCPQTIARATPGARCRRAAPSGDHRSVGRRAGRRQVRRRRAGGRDDRTAHALAGNALDRQSASDGRRARDRHVLCADRWRARCLRRGDGQIAVAALCRIRRGTAAGDGGRQCFGVRYQASGVALPGPQTGKLVWRQELANRLPHRWWSAIACSSPPNRAGCT